MKANKREQRNERTERMRSKGCKEKYKRKYETTRNEAA